MPIYEYKCSSCGNITEELQSMTEAPLVKCPKCGEDALKKLIGSGSGLIFKGSGFYLTDYKKSSGDKAIAESSDKPKSKPETKSETKTATKVATKSTDNK